MSQALNFTQVFNPSVWGKTLMQRYADMLTKAGRYFMGTSEVCVLTRAAAMDELQQLVNESPGAQLIELLRDAVEDGWDTLEPSANHYDTRMPVETDNDLLKRLSNLRQRIKSDDF